MPSTRRNRRSCLVEDFCIAREINSTHMVMWRGTPTYASRPYTKWGSKSQFGLRERGRESASIPGGRAISDFAGLHPIFSPLGDVDREAAKVNVVGERHKEPVWP